MTIRTAPLFLVSLTFLAVAATPGHWIATWGASPAPQLRSDEEVKKAHLSFENETLREIVHVSAGSDLVRIRLSNAFGKEAVRIGGAHVALRKKDSAIAAGTDRALTFSGRAGASIPANATLLSDPVPLEIPASADLAISIYLPEAAEGAGIHYSAQQTSFVAAGDRMAAADLTDAKTMTSWIFLSGVDILARNAGATIVAFGDSITDGAHATVDANTRWPNVLAERLLAKHQNFGVVDAGIGGNRILHAASGNVRFGVSALARFDADGLGQPGVKYVIVLEGINDLGHAGTSAPASETVSAEDIIAGLKQLIERAHEKGVAIIGGTLTPFEGAQAKGYFTPEKEEKRKAVNDWIRKSKAFDGVIDFDQAVRDPEHPDRMLPAYDSGDHLHPGDAGYRAMGEAIDLSLFR